MMDSERVGYDPKSTREPEENNPVQALPGPAPEDALEQGPYEDGFSIRTVVGALFVAFVMMPGSIYLGLVAGQTLGSAAEWVTIILVAELARRSFTYLKRQEVFVLFYVASAIAAGGPFASAIWNQYLLQSPQTSSIASQIPDWVVPPIQSLAIQNRNLSHPDWWWSASKGFLSPISLMLVAYLLGRLTWFGVGYIVFRLTSDIERLPFPLAPIAAEGATALSESTDREEGGGFRRKRSWRWNTFSMGACLGVVFGALYVLLPVVTGLFMAKPIMIFPIPFVDLTRNVESILPSSLVSFSFDAGLFLAGMVLPFWLVIGTMSAILATSVFGNPILLKMGAFQHWTPGNGLLVNQMVLNFDFWMSVTIGLAAAIALIGVGNMVRVFSKNRKASKANRNMASPDTGNPASHGAAGPRPPDDPPNRMPSRARGDFPIWIAIALSVFAIFCFCWISHVLVPGFPVWIIAVFGFIWSPLHSYISARLVGMTGHPLGTPYLKETAFIFSGYRGVDIWFAPIPLFDHGGAAQRFRELELTRTKFTSIIKAEILMFFIIFLSSFLFWWFFWHVNQIPSSSFPFVARMWPVAARQTYLILTANSSETPLLLQALKPEIITGALAVGIALYGGFAWVGLPVAFFYGVVGGVGAPLHAGLSMLLGALLGRYYFARKYGSEKWARLVPVFAAGFACGMGLAGMTAVALSLISQCTRELPF